VNFLTFVGKEFIHPKKMEKQKRTLQDFFAKATTKSKKPYSCLALFIERKKLYSHSLFHYVKPDKGEIPHKT